MQIIQKLVSGVVGIFGMTVLTSGIAFGTSTLVGVHLGQPGMKINVFLADFKYHQRNHMANCYVD
jgi:hypothetical protein